MRKQDGPRQVSEPSICYRRREKDKDEENSDYTGRRTICSGRFLRLQRSISMSVSIILVFKIKACYWLADAGIPMDLLRLTKRVI